MKPIDYEDSDRDDAEDFVTPGEAYAAGYAAGYADGLAVSTMIALEQQGGDNGRD